MDTDLGQMILARGMLHAERPALWVDGTSHTYGELADEALKIADALVETGPAKRCAIFGTRTFASFAGVAGCLMAKATYVPLHLRHPTGRLLALLETADVDAIILDARSLGIARDLLRQLPKQLVVILVDSPHPPDWAIGLPHLFVCRDSLQARMNRLPPENEGVYLLFTSGSTGAPKGVMVGQTNVMAYLRTASERYRLTPEDRCTQLFDLTFDLSVHDMLVTWHAGATLYCPSEMSRTVPHEFVRQHALTCWFSVPSTAAMLAQFRLLKPGAYPSLRWSLFCGEALPRSLVTQWADAAPNSRIENLYGPTETTIAVTGFEVERSAVASLPDIVPIGAVFPGHRAVIVDQESGSVDGAETGELCISGPQVALGYWHNPRLTGERFAPPVRHYAGRWYRTGDRVRRTSFGLEFLGRLDRQVKISGYRIELQEVEAVLRRVAGPSVAVLAWPFDRNGLPHGLAGFVGKSAPPTETILADCRKQLPSYMVPAQIVRLDGWPVTASGKINYHELRRRLEEGT